MNTMDWTEYIVRVNRRRNFNGMASGGGDKFTSTPGRGSRPPKLELDESRILGYVRQRSSASDSTFAGGPAMSTQVGVGVAAPAGASSSSSSASAAAMATSYLTKYNGAEQRKILRAKYLQAAFLKVKADERLVKQRTELTTQMDRLIAYQDGLIDREMERRSKEQAATTKMLVEESHHQLLDIAPSEQLSSIVGPCEALDAAITSSMQHLPVDNVIVPDNDDVEWSSLLQAMRECGNVDAVARSGPFVEAVTEEAKFVRELSDVMRNQTEDMHSMTKQMDSLAQVVDKEACLRSYKN